MDNLLEFISRHAVAGTIMCSFLLVVIGILLLAGPDLILHIIRYGLAGLNIAGGLFLLIRTLHRTWQK